jgi:hypothetical protein
MATDLEADVEEIRLVFVLRGESWSSTWSTSPRHATLSIGPGGCMGERDPTDAAPTASPRAAWIYVSGTHGMAHAALGQLPVRALARALAR